MKGRQGICGIVGTQGDVVRCVGDGGCRQNGEKPVKTVHQRTDGGE